MKTINEINKILENNENINRYIKEIENNKVEVRENLSNIIIERAINITAKKSKKTTAKTIFNYAKVAGFAIVVFAISEACINLSENVEKAKVLGFNIGIEEKINEVGKDVSNFLLEPIHIDKEEE